MKTTETKTTETKTTETKTTETKLPAPMRKPPQMGQVYYYLYPLNSDGWDSFEWVEGPDIDNSAFRNGIFDEEWKVKMWADYLRSALK